VKLPGVKGSLIFTIGLFIFALAFTFISLTYQWQGRIVPVLVGVGTLTLGVILLIKEKFPNFLKGFDEGLFSSVVKTPGSQDKQTAEGSIGKRFLIMCGWVAVLFGLIYLVGVYIASAVFLFLFFKVRGKTPWLKTAGLTVVISGALYLMFDLLLRLDLFTGVLFGAFVPPI